ncbi:MAG: ribosome biogenesis GTPase YlqF [Clostridia bacterium]|jgi:ribosome biogenesis GTPase A|nr:ribosome biogenesis GTPase YlqF [Clostridia bacterium]
MPSENIQWFPGHMAKTRRIIKECLPSVDIVLELTDARIPYSSRNPELFSIIGQKPLLTVLNKASLADPDITALWREEFASRGQNAIVTDCQTNQGISAIRPAIERILSEKIERYENKGMSGRTLKAMVVGIPNVGKSTLINRLAGAKKAKAEDRPGVTVIKQWVPTSIGLDLLDMPGVLWPKFEDRTVGENLALTGAINDSILDIETIAVALCSRLRKIYPELLCQRYKLGDPSSIEDLDDYDLFCLIGKKRGCIVSGGEINEERTAIMLLDEFRGSKIGKISLERP